MWTEGLLSEKMARNLRKLIDWACGPGLIVLATFLQLAPKTVTSTFLLVAGRRDDELLIRRALTQALVVSLTAEMAWTAVFPSGVSLRWAGVSLGAGTMLTAVLTTIAFTEDQNSPKLAFWLLTLSGLLTIPINQATSKWRLAQSRSPARWRMWGWIYSVGKHTSML